MRHLQRTGSGIIACAVMVAAYGMQSSASAQACEPEWDVAVGQPGINGAVGALAEFGGDIYAGGDFTQAGGAVAHSIARWNGEEWSPVRSGIPELLGGGTAVHAMTVFNDGAGEALYVGGLFWKAGGVEVDGIARWDGAEWFAVNSPGGSYRDFAVFDDGSGEALYVGGGPGVFRYDGSEWVAVGERLGVLALEVFDDGSGAGAQLYAAGSFSEGIARWDGVEWSPLGTGLGAGYAYANSLAVFDDGSGPALYAGGHFDVAGGVPVSGIAKWNGSEWSDVGGGLASRSTETGAYSLQVFDDGSGPALYAGGPFDEAGGETVETIARWDGSEWSSLGFGRTHSSTTIHAMTAVEAGGRADLYVGGFFPMAAGVPANSVAVLRGCDLCYADCDGSGELDFFDFLCFQNAFAAMEPSADCDDSGSLDFFDFLCFQNEFAAGCP